MTESNSPCYIPRDLEALDEAGGYYTRHFQAVQQEGLDSRSDIAAELAYRDMVIARLRRQMALLKVQNGKLSAELLASRVLNSQIKADPDRFPLSQSLYIVCSGPNEAQPDIEFASYHLCEAHAYLREVCESSNVDTSSWRVRSAVYADVAEQVLRERNARCTELGDLLAEAMAKLEHANDKDANDPCPGCAPGTVCRTPKCGRLAKRNSVNGDTEPTTDETPLTLAVRTLIQSLQKDPGYAWGWHSNIAMAFVDSGVDRYTANQGAARFMRSFAGVEPAQALPEPPAQPEAPPAASKDLHLELVAAAQSLVSVCRAKLYSENPSQKHGIPYGEVNNLHDVLERLSEEEPEDAQTATVISTLMAFYDCKSLPALVLRMDGHIQSLQARLRPAPSMAPRFPREG